MVTLEDLIAEQLKVNETHIQKYREGFGVPTESWQKKNIDKAVENYAESMNKPYLASEAVIESTKSQDNFSLVQGLTEEDCGCMSNPTVFDIQCELLNRLELTARLINIGFIPKDARL